MTLSTIRLTHPVINPRLVLLNDFHALVGAPPIHHDVLQIRIPLQEHRANRLFDELPLVVAGRDDADLGPGRSVGLRVGKRVALLGPRPAGFVGGRRGEVLEGGCGHTCNENTI